MPNNKPAILITGASGGIGSVCAAYLASRGYRVFAGVRAQRSLEQLKLNQNDHVFPIILDVNDLDSVYAALAQVEDKMEGAGLYGLINNAAMSYSGPFEHFPVSMLQEIVTTNLTGLMLTTQTFLPLIRKGKGRIINIGSLASHVYLPYNTIYGATKSALTGFSNALRIELQSFGVEVVLIEPGNISTGIWIKAIEFLDQLEQSLPLHAKKEYQVLTDLFRANLTKASPRGANPEIVARKIQIALEKKNPRPRYLVGVDAHILATLLSIFPLCLRDQLITRLLNLPRKST